MSATVVSFPLSRTQLHRSLVSLLRRTKPENRKKALARSYVKRLDALVAKGVDREAAARECDELVRRVFRELDANPLPPYADTGTSAREASREAR